MRKLYPFGWIDRDLKDLGFLKQMSSSATKLYILYVLAGGANGRSCYSAKALMEATGLSKATIYKARQELEDISLIAVQKEMVYGHRNKKPKVWVELQDLPVDRIEIKQRRDKAREDIVIKKIKKNRNATVIARRAEGPPKQSQSQYTMPVWMKELSQKRRQKSKPNVL